MPKKKIARIIQGITLLCLGLGFIFLLLSSIDFYIIQPTFQLLEEQQAIEDGNRIRSAIVHENSNMGDIANDWAIWDDTYGFAQNQNDGYVKSNCADFAILSKNSNIDLLVIFDRKGRILIQGGYQPDLKQSVDWNVILSSRPATLSRLAPVFENGTSIDGLLYTNYGICLLSARPILNSLGQGPSRGVLVMGRFLTNSALEALSTRVQVRFDLLPQNSDQLTVPEQDLLYRLASSASLQPEFRQGFLYQTYLDIEKKPVLLLRSQTRGEILAIGAKTGNILKTTLFLISLLLLICLVTYRARMQFSKDAQREANDRLLTVLNSTNAVIYIADMQTHELLFVNKCGLKAFGGNIIGQKCWKVLQGLDSPCSFCSNDKLLTADNKLAGYYRWEWQNNVNRRWYELNDCAIRWTDGRIVRMETAIDITESKQAEEDRSYLERQLRLAQKDESLARMAGAIAHHCNNLLSVVIGNLELVAEDLPDDDAGIREKLKDAIVASDRASEIGKLMLAYLGQTFVPRKSLDLGKESCQWLSDIQLDMPDCVALEVSIPSSGPVIYANADQIKQVVDNLVDNARESIAEIPGVIYLIISTATSMDIPAVHLFPAEFQSEETNYLCFEVRDTGCGIEEDNIEKIFDPFFSTKFVGRGMGLAMVLRIVKSHAGCITVESIRNGGSTFRVFLPLWATPAS